MIELLETTSQLMLKYGIPTRDTWQGLNGDNLDDFYSNGNRYGGPRLVEIQHLETNEGFAAVAGTKYEIPGRNHSAYDAYKIRLPLRLKGKTHPIVHELVHFLQENTTIEDNNYIQFNGRNYIEYVSQKSELEAHFIQCIYIREFEPEVISCEKLEQTDQLIKNSADFGGKLGLIILFKGLGLI